MKQHPYEYPYLNEWLDTSYLAQKTTLCYSSLFINIYSMSLSNWKPHETLGSTLTPWLWRSNRTSILLTPSPSLVSFTAVGSTDNIDTSLDPYLAANTYSTNSNKWNSDQQADIYSYKIKKLTRIWVYPVAKGTWNWKVTVHDASNVVQATITITNASLQTEQ